MGKSHSTSALSSGAVPFILNPEENGTVGLRQIIEEFHKVLQYLCRDATAFPNQRLESYYCIKMACWFQLNKYIISPSFPILMLFSEIQFKGFHFNQDKPAFQAKDCAQPYIFVGL